MLPCSHCLRGKPRHRLNFVNTARRRSGSGSQHGCETEHPHAGRESWRRVRVGSAQPSPLPASPSPLNKHPCTKQKARRIPPPFPSKRVWSPLGASRCRDRSCSEHRPQPPPRPETPLGEKTAKVPFEFFHQYPNKYIWAGKSRRQIPSCYSRALTGLVSSVKQSRKSGLSYPAEPPLPDSLVSPLF